MSELAWSHKPLPCRYVMQTYARPELVFTHGEGARLYDAHGKEYLDFAAGIAVNALGNPPSYLAVLLHAVQSYTLPSMPCAADWRFIIYCITCRSQ